MPVQYFRHPAAVVTSDGVNVNRSAVVVIDGRAQLAVQTAHAHHEPAGVEVLATMDDVTVGEPAGGSVTLQAADGRYWTVREGDGCGCTSPLTVWLRQQVRGQSVGT